MSKMNPENKREMDVKQLYEWALKNTDLLKIKPEMVIRFLDSEKEKLDQNLFFVSKVFEDIVNYSQTKFKIGKYVSIGYSNTVLLKLTENFDILEFRKTCQENELLIKPHVEEDFPRRRRFVDPGSRDFCCPWRHGGSPGRLIRRSAGLGPGSIPSSVGEPAVSEG